MEILHIKDGRYECRLAANAVVLVNVPQGGQLQKYLYLKVFKYFFSSICI